MAVRLQGRRRYIGTAIKLFLACLVVGWLLSVVGVTPERIWIMLGQTAEDVAQMGFSFVEWAIRFVLIGAVVVLPIWLALFGWRKLRGRC